MSTTKGRSGFLVGLFLICMCGLMLQIVETRLLSVIAYYYLAFFAIGMAMFGMTAGSLFVYLRERLFPRDRLLHNLVWICSAFAISVVISGLLLVSTVLVTMQGLSDLPMAVLEWSEAIFMLASPYFFAGMAISLALTRSPWPVTLVYGVDLVGAASGCLVVLVVLTVIDSVSALFLIGAIGAMAAVFFSRAERAMRAERGLASPARPSLRPSILATVILVLAIGNAVIQPWGIRLSVVKDHIESIQNGALIVWNSFSRIEAGPSVVREPEMWGPSPRMPAFQVEQRHLAIDGSAASPSYRFDGDLHDLAFLDYDITNLAYSIRNKGRAAVIGVGGGRDLLSAARFGFRDITGVELNPIFVGLLKKQLADYNQLARLPGVRLFADEGRSWFARSNEHFDVLEMSMVDTWAATGAGAFSLSENGLYTVEGWRVFFRHLTPTGVFTVSRWYSPTNINETGRMLSVAVAALLDEGVSNPRDHLYLATAGNKLATLIVSRAPFTPAEIATLTKTVDKLGFTVAARPGQPVASPVLTEILSARSPQALNQLANEYDLDLSPAYDDRPFFFQQLRMTPHAIGTALASQSGVIRGNLKANMTLALIILLSVALVIATIVVPSLSSIRDVDARIALFGSAYFLLIGLGFMFVEIGVIQRTSVYLGHPVYGLAIGLFGMIASTGVGSLLSGAIPLLRPSRLIAWSVLIGLYLLVLPYGLAALVATFAQAPLPVRALISLAAIVPSGVLMGFGFPTGMQIANSVDARPTPWFWAINGAAGVLASGLAVIVSIEYSISTTIWCGAAAYLLLGPVAIWFMQRDEQARGVLKAGPELPPQEA